MTSIAVRVKTWLSSTWHVKVPDQWLEACISWLQQENSSSLSQAEINKQVFEQWLLTDLRDLQFPILPYGMLESQKWELNGYYAVQLDSLVDVSLPAYSQLQKLRGRDNTNEQVTATTQASQKPWEAKPNRMLMLQLTDGTQQIQGMEYRPLPTLNSNLSPGTKILLQGTIVTRLGVLLLKSENVRVLGGEVEALVEEYTQDKVLSRLIGAEDNSLPQRLNAPDQVAVRGVREQVLGPSDEDLLASLDDNEEFTINNGTTPESGYYSRSENTSISYLEYQQVQNSVARQEASQTGIVQTNSRDDLEGEYDLDDDLLLEEEIQRELEEMPMEPPPSTNQDMGTERVQHMAVMSQTTYGIQSSVSKRTSDGLLDCSPFTYLSVVLPSPGRDLKCFKLKSFIVTLNGTLTSSGGFWNIKAKISDGTDYLDVTFNDNVLTKLIGFSVSEMKKMKRDPGQQQKLMAGLQKCQVELTDFCGIMTISYDPTKSEANVVALEEVNEEVMQSLRRRLRP
ncbi:recQ-mediated genome instability protein 1 [Pelodytes ibericus]